MIVKHSTDETPKPTPVSLRLARVISIGNGTVDVCPIGSSVVLHDIPVTSAGNIQEGDVINIQMIDNRRFAFATQSASYADTEVTKSVTIQNGDVIIGGTGGGSSTVPAHLISDLSVHTGTITQSQAPWAVPQSTIVSAGSGLTGGGTLSGNLSFAVATATGTGLVISSNVLRLSDAIAGSGLSYSSGVISVNQAFAFSWTAAHAFGAGLTATTGTFTGGLNVGTATGAATGEVRASQLLLAGATSGTQGQIRTYAAYANSDFRGLTIANTGNANLTFQTASISLLGVNESARLVGGNQNSGDGASGFFAVWTRANVGTIEERLRINSAGNVGIGTAAPFANASRFVHLSGTTSELHLTSDLSGHGQTDGLSIQMWSDNIAYFIQRENAAMEFWTNNAKKVVIDSAGRLGIGNFPPSYSLDVSGDSRVTGGLNVGIASSAATGEIRTSSASNPRIVIESTGPTSSSRSFLRFSGAVAGDFMSIGYYPDGSPRRMQINYNGESVSLPIMSLTSTNRVGINMQIPSYTLDVSGDIRASASVITQELTGAGASTSVSLTNGTGFKSSQYASGFAGNGWRIYRQNDSTKAEWEVDNLTVRGTLSVYELLIQQIRATNGSVFVSAAAKIESVSGTGPYTLIVEGNDANPTTGVLQDYAPFAVGDVIRAQRVSLGTSTLVWQSDLTVTAINVGSNPRTFTATLRSGSAAPAAGMEYVRLGSNSDTNRQGAIYLTADDSGAPFIDIVDGVSSHADWNSAGAIKARIGRLTGISGSSGTKWFDIKISATGGSFTLTAIVNGVSATTASISYSATPATMASRIQSALVLLANVGSNVSVSSVSLSSSTIYTVRFSGDLDNASISLSATSSLTGTSPSINVNASSNYGIWAGNGTDRSNQWVKLAEDGILLNNVPLKMYSGGNQTVDFAASGNLKIGTNVTNPSTTALTWDGATLSIDGDITARSGSFEGYVTIGTAGGIRQGTGTWTSTFTGLGIDAENSRGRIRFFEGGAIRAAFGNLNNHYGYTTNTYGIASGSNTNYTAADANGFRVANNSVVRFAVDTQGNILLMDSGGVQRMVLTSAGVFVAGDTTTSSSIWVDATNGFRVRNNNVSRFSVDTSGNVALRDGAGVQRMALTSAGVIELDDAAGAARVLIDSGGLRLRDSNGNAAITLDASGNSQFTGAMNIASTGGIYQGNGTFASPGTGLKIFSSGVNHVSSITVTATGGTFTITVVRTDTGASATTGSLAYNIAATGTTSMQTSLQALSSVGSGNATVTKTGNVYTITFAGARASTKMTVTVATGSLTGGTATVATVTDGGIIGRIAGYKENGLQWFADTDGSIKAGGGDVVIDSNGISVQTSTLYDPKNAYSFITTGSDQSSIGVYNETYSWGSTISSLNIKQKRSSGSYISISAETASQGASAGGVYIEGKGKTSYLGTGVWSYPGVTLGSVDTVNSPIVYTYFSVKPSSFYFTNGTIYGGDDVLADAVKIYGINVGTATGAAQGQIKASAGIIATTASFSSTLAVTGAATLSSTLAVTGASTLSGGYIAPSSNGSAVFAIDSSAGSSTTLAQNGTMTPFGNANNFAGLVMITNTTNRAVGLFLVGSGIVMLSDSSGNTYSASSGTASRINVFLNSNVVTVNNTIAANRTVIVTGIRLTTQQV